jgi:hypothetical protein
MLKLLVKTLGYDFYQQHAGLFLVVFYLLFGAVEGSQLISYHFALLKAICSSPVVWLLVLALWILYAIKCFLFIKRKFSLSSFLFIREVARVKLVQQHRVWIKIYAFMLLPILAYAAIMIYVSVRFSYYFTLFGTLVGIFSLLLIPTVLTVKNLNNDFKPVEKLSDIHILKIKKPFWSWPLFYLLNQQPLMLFACKIASLLSLKAILWVFADVGDDIRVLVIAAFAAMLSHAIIIFNLIKFDAFYLSFSRTLQHGILRKLGNWLVVLVVLLLPEIALLTWLLHFDLLPLLAIVVFCIAMIFSLLTMVYLLSANMERYLKFLLFFFFITMMAILFGYYFAFSLCLLIGILLIAVIYYPKIDLKDFA